MNYLDTLKNIAKDKNKRVENLVFLLILLVILLISTKYIFSSNSTSNQNNKIDNNKDNKLNINSKENAEQKDNITQNLETKLENILAKITGISEVSVVLTYSKDTTTTPIYNVSEEEKEGSKTTEKSVAYNEESGKKTAIIESVQMPQIEGAIVVAKGANNTEIKSKIASAVSTVTNVPVYKVQVFESN